MALPILSECSECLDVKEIELSPGAGEITCPRCGHSVPNLEPADIGLLQNERAKEDKLSKMSLVLAGAGVLLTLIFVTSALPDATATVTKTDGTTIEGYVVVRSETDNVPDKNATRAERRGWLFARTKTDFVTVEPLEEDEEVRIPVSEINSIESNGLPATSGMSKLFALLAIVLGVASAATAFLASQARVFVQY